MKLDAKHAIKQILTDRPFFLMAVLAWVLILVFVVYVIASVQQSTVQIHTQYSGIGEAHYYKSPWHYLYAFAAFALIMGVVNTLGMLKLYSYQRRDAAVGVWFVTLIILTITFFYTRNVLELALI